MRDRQPGDKLLPKVMQAVIQTVIGANTGLTGHKYNLGVNVGQELIDRMGHEIADLYEPFVRSALEDERLSPKAREWLQQVASGANQWQAVLGFAVSSSGAANVLGQVIGNELAPIGYDLVATNPHLIPSIDTVVSLRTRAIIDEGTAQDNAAKLGYDSGWYQAMETASWNWPPLDQIYEMLHRGLISESDANGYIDRQGVPPELAQAVYDMQASILSVQDAALAVLRTDITHDEGLTIAAQNGYGPDDFAIFLANTGEPPGAQELQEALRRGFIDETTFRLGIAQSRVRDQWQDTLLALRYSPLATADAVDAYVEGYVTEDTVKSVADQNGLEPDQYKILIEAAGDPLSYTDMMRLWRYNLATEDDVKAALKRGRLKDDYIDFALALKDSPMSVPDAIEASIQGYLTKDAAKAIAVMNGLREEDFDPLWSTAGDPASRTEMIQLWRRNLVTQDQVEDALRQSRLKDAYIPDVLKLKVQLPALYEVRALLASGGLSAEQGTQILLAQGYEADIVKGIVSNAVSGTTAGTKALTEAMYVELYNEGSITSQEFQEALVTLGYSQADSELIQEIQDNKLVITQRNGVITKIKSGYVGHRINEAEAQSELNQLGIPAGMVDRLISDWDLIIDTDVKLLTQAQVADAWQMQFFNQNDPADNITQALDYLANLGYSGPDALIILEIKAKGLLDSGTGVAPVSASASTSSIPTTAGG
jgi:hypothetical protein